MQQCNIIMRFSIRQKKEEKSVDIDGMNSNSSLAMIKVYI
jgi:hypothetical protein